MLRFAIRSIRLAALATLINLNGVARADDAETFDQLNEQFWEQIDAGKLPAAEKTATQLIQIGRRLKANGNPFAITVAWENLAKVYLDDGRYQQAADLYAQSMNARREEYGEQDEDYAVSKTNLGDAYYQLGRYAEAMKMYEQALPILREKLGEDSETVALTYQSMADVHAEYDRYKEADALLQKSLAIMQKLYGKESEQVADAYEYLATNYLNQERFDEARAAASQARAIRKRLFDADNLTHAFNQWTFGDIYIGEGRYAEAEKALSEALAALQKAYGDDTPEIARCQQRLAVALRGQGRLTEAESLCRKSLTMLERKLGPMSPLVSHGVYLLASSYLVQGHFAEAEALYKRAWTLSEKIYGPKSVTTAWCKYDLGLLNVYRGRYAEAETLCNEALSATREALGEDNSSTAFMLSGLGDVFWYQQRMEQAAELYERALRIQQKVLRPDHPDAAWTMTSLGSAYTELGRYDEAEKHLEKAIELSTRSLGADHIDTNAQRFYLGQLYARQGRYDDAEKIIRTAMAQYEKTFGGNHPDIGSAHVELAELQLAQQQTEEAEKSLDRAIAILDRSGAYPADRFKAYSLRARMGWDAGRRSEALADLRVAMTLAEEERANSAGSERERAKFFVNYATAYEQMVAWQLELGDVAEALSAMERARARSLLDELSLSGSSLDIGRTAAERDQLQKREAELKSRIASLEQKIKSLTAGRDAKPDAAELANLEQQLSAARNDLYEHYRDSRSSNPIYRNLLATATSAPRLSQIQRNLLGEQGLLLVYQIGEQNGYLAAIGSDSAKLVALSFDAAAANAFGVEAGPLTHERLTKALIGDGGTLQDLASANRAGRATDKLWHLWQNLIPADERDAITAGKIKRLVIMPDGPLALLPFETLVVSRGDSPTYLLDVGPPIHYGPSATIMINLRDRSDTGAAEQHPVLSVGNPKYASTATEASDSIDSQSRYAALGGQLPPLPFTAWETSWVHDVFGKKGIEVDTLTGAAATEAKVREQSRGKRYLHLACHGLADQSHGNLFGSLALTPGESQNDPANDGFLTLAEIYELNLRGNELTILSACNTNYGPQQRGEGVWALSRGFLVSGARRVVASNWVVDDRASASLISYFCSGVAAAESKHEPVDYAQSLHAAKKWVRSQEQWSSPYYWGTFVLVGPN